MILHLIDNSTVEITRTTCAHYIPHKSCDWNINPIELVNDGKPGYIAIAEWRGCDGHIETPENFKQLIPVRSIVKISEIGVW